MNYIEYWHRMKKFSPKETRVQTPIDKCICGGEGSLTWKETRGHGDVCYEHLRVRCGKCTLSFGDTCNWGTPEHEAKEETITNWNKMIDQIKYKR
jgi:hypothetical protein